MLASEHRRERGVNARDTNGLDGLATGGRFAADDAVRRFLIHGGGLSDVVRVALHRMFPGRGHVGGVIAAFKSGATLGQRVPGAERMSLHALLEHPEFDWGPHLPVHAEHEETHAEASPADNHEEPTGRPKALSPNVLVEVPHGRGGKHAELEPDTANAYESLLAAARAAGFAAPLFTIASAHRSDEEQEAIFRAAVKKHGSEKAARRFAAAPQHSKHRSGKAIDFWLGLSPSSENIEAMRKTEAYKWLAANAPTYGFNPYSVEPWHWEHN